MKSTTFFEGFLYKSIILITLLFNAGTLTAQQGGAIYQAGPTMMRAKIFPPATVLDNGKVITFGGREFNFISCAYADMYDPIANSFTEAAMNYPHDGAATVKLSDGRYFLLGGSMDLGVAPGYATTEMYNPVTNTFDTKSAMTMARCNVSAVQLLNGKVLVVGAWYNNNGAAYGEIYDTAANTFTATAGALLQPRSQPIVLPTTDGGAIVAGGYPTFGGGIYTSVEYYQTATNDFISQSSEIIPADPGWLLNPVYTRPIADLRMSNGNYLLYASRMGASGGEYALIMFDPATKLFSKLVTVDPLKDSLTDGGFFDVILNKDDNFAYLMGVDSASDPNRLSLITVNLSTGEAFHPTTSFTMPAQEYFYAAYTYMPSNGKILVQGINSTNTGYFTGTDKTYILTPQITSGINNLNAGANNISLLAYPNPAHNQLYVSIEVTEPESYNIKLVDMQGKEMINDIRQISSNGKATIMYSTQHFAQGLYKLIISSKSKFKTESILISR